MLFGATLLVLILAGALPFGLAALFDSAGIRIAAGALLVVLLPAVVTMHARLNSALIMNPVGISMGGFSVPWQSIAQLVVSNLDSAREVEISARLHPDAPIPASAGSP